MSKKELDRLSTVEQVIGKVVTQRQAAYRLGVSVRQIKRLVRQYRLEGAQGLVNKQRGKPANNRIAESIRHAVLTLVRQHYADFGPTLACEKLNEIHGHQLSNETLRQWMIAQQIWHPKARRRAHIHQHRPRRACYGELIQIDGSPHDWFEGRAPYCTLIVFIDDATSRLMALKFVPAETTRAYMETLGEYLDTHGRPVALYSDKHSIFRENRPNQDNRLTQFSRAVRTLDIEIINANTPQAKGRVERANQTLQDRLCKELRLQQINDLETANAFLSSYMDDYNERFGVAAQDSENAHRALRHQPDELALILSNHARRKVTKNLTLQYKNQILLILKPGYRLRGTTVTVCEAFDGALTVLHDGKPLPVKCHAQGERVVPLDDEKSVHHTVDQAKQRQRSRSRYKPKADHPWHQFTQIAVDEAQAKSRATL